jgi:hypothetical protein
MTGLSPSSVQSPANWDYPLSNLSIPLTAVYTDIVQRAQANRREFVRSECHLIRALGDLGSEGRAIQETHPRSQSGRNRLVWEPISRPLEP